MRLKEGLIIEDSTIVDAIKKQYGFDVVDVVDNVCFCAKKEITGDIVYSVYEMTHINSAKTMPTETEVFIKELDRTQSYDGVHDLGDGYIVIENHLFYFNGDAGGRI